MGIISFSWIDSFYVGVFRLGDYAGEVVVIGGNLASKGGDCFLGKGCGKKGKK